MGFNPLKDAVNLFRLSTDFAFSAYTHKRRLQNTHKEAYINRLQHPTPGTNILSGHDSNIYRLGRVKKHEQKGVSYWFPEKAPREETEVQAQLKSVAEALVRDRSREHHAAYTTMEVRDVRKDTGSRPAPPVAPMPSSSVPLPPESLQIEYKTSSPGNSGPVEEIRHATSILIKYAKDGSPDTRSLVGEILCRFSHILWNLSKDEDPSVRYKIVNSPHCPMEILGGSLEDNCAFVSKRALRTINEIRKKVEKDEKQSAGKENEKKESPVNKTDSARPESGSKREARLMDALKRAAESRQDRKNKPAELEGEKKPGLRPVTQSRYFRRRLPNIKWLFWINNSQEKDMPLAK